MVFPAACHMSFSIRFNGALWMLRKRNILKGFATSIAKAPRMHRLKPMN